MTRFADHFSRDSAAYARFRPTYPRELFLWVATLPAARRVAWDCGTGTGQAAAGLTASFETVVASDPSRSQLAAANRTTGVRYFCAPAEASGLRQGRIDLVTVAQAMHWIDSAEFFREVDRVLAPGGALALWTYGTFRSSPPIDGIVGRFYKETVGPYWPAERALVEAGYRSLELPIEEVAPPAFTMRAELTLPAVLGYVRTWSAVGRYLSERGRDPVVELERELAPVWGDPDQERTFEWPMSVRAGRWRQAAGSPA